MVEPYYKLYDGNFQSGAQEGSFSGRIYGANLGYLGDYFMAGLTLENGEYISDNTLTTEGFEKYKGGGIGTYIGFHFLDSWKVWTGYLNSALEPTSNKQIRYFGQHVSFGAGYRIWQGLILNIEGFRNQYTQQEDDTTGLTSGLETNMKTEGTSYFLSYFLVC